MLDPRDTTQATRTTQAGPRAPAPPGKARAGAPFGPYDLQDELGRGGMGAVFRARERATGRVVAVKVVLGEVEPEGLERFRREGQIAGSLDHPGIVRVHSAGVVDGTPYLACELVEGARSLVAAAAALPPLERARLVRDAARALGHAHARGVVHRDVKPDNLLVDALGRVRVTDFGVAAARGLERLTATGQLVGTPAYMAPEQLDGDRSRLGPWTDVWALGAVLHEALTGRRPFDGPSLPALFRQILTGVPRPVHELAPGTPPALADVVARAMAKAFEARYAHADALADDLERVLAARRTEAAEAEAARRARRALRGLALGAGAVALLGAAVVAAARPAAPVAPPPPRVDWVALAAEREAAGDLPGAIAALGSALAAADAEPEALRARRGALELRALRERAEARARTGDLDGALADREALVRAGDPEERVLEVLAARVERRLEAPRLSRVAARALLADVERLLPAGGRRAERAIGARGVARWALRALDIDDDAARAARADLDRALRVADEPRLRLERARTWVATRDSGAMAEDLDRARGPFDLRLAASLATLRADVTIALGRLELAEDEQARPLGALAEGSVVRGRARLRAAVEELDQVLRQEESPLAHLLRAQARRLLADGGRLTAAEAQAVEADELAALEGAAALEATSPGPLADLLERHGRPGALELLERAASDPTDASLLLRLQAQRRRAGDLQRALADLDRLVQRFPDQLQPRVERLGCRGAAGDPVGALEDLDALLALAPDPGAVRTSTDDVAALLGRLRDDLAARGPDAARRASYGDVFLAHEALRRSDLDTAVSALQRALQRSPDLAPASALLADALPRRARSRLVDGDLAGAAADRRGRGRAGRGLGRRRPRPRGRAEAPGGGGAPLLRRARGGGPVRGGAGPGPGLA